MAGRGQQSFQKRQKEQQRKERQQEKMAKRLERKRQAPGVPDESLVSNASRPETAERDPQ